MAPILDPALFTPESYREFNDRLAKSLALGKSRTRTALDGPALLGDAHGHLRRASRNGFASPRAVEALHAAVSSMLQALAVAR